MVRPPSTLFKSKQMHKLSMISSVLPIKFHSKLDTIRKDRQPAGWPAQSVKKLAGTADGKIKSFEIGVRGIKCKENTGTRLKPYAFLTHWSRMGFLEGHSIPLTALSEIQKFCQLLCWEQRSFKYYSHKTLKCHLSIQSLSGLPSPSKAQSSTDPRRFPSRPPVLLSSQLSCCSSTSWWIAAVCSQEF